MLSNFPTNMNCIFAFTWPNLCSQLFYDALQLTICHAHLWHPVPVRQPPVKIARIAFLAIMLKSGH